MHTRTAVRGVLAGIVAAAICGLAGAQVAQARTGQERTSHAEAVLRSISTGGELQSANVWSPALGAHASDPVGYVMVIHGGGWMATGAGATDATLADVTNLREAGWGVYDIDYRAGEASFADVTAAYDHMRSVLGRPATICVLGQSAGAHLALLLAAREPAIRCVIGEAAPIDLLSLPTQPAWAPAGTSAQAGPEWTFDKLIVPTFGADPAALAAWSPVSYAAEIKAHMLLGGSTFDWVIPDAAQMAEMRDAAPSGAVDTMMLGGVATPTGQATNFPHASITAAALAKWQAAELRMLDWAAAQSG